MVDCTCAGQLEVRVGLVDLGHRRLERAARDAAAEHCRLQRSTARLGRVEDEMQENAW